MPIKNYCSGNNISHRIMLIWPLRSGLDINRVNCSHFYFLCLYNNNIIPLPSLQTLPHTHLCSSIRIQVLFLSHWLLLHVWVCMCVCQHVHISEHVLCVVVEHSPNGFIYNKNPALSAQGSLQKEGERYCKSQRKKTYSCESVSTRNGSRNTPIIYKYLKMISFRRCHPHLLYFGVSSWKIGSSNV